GDSAGRDYRRVAGQVEHLREERERAESSGVATCLVALGHEHVGADGQREAGRLRRLDLTQNPGPDALGLRHVRRGIAEREREDGNTLLEARTEILDPLRDLFGDEPDAEWLAGPRAHEPDLLTDPRRATTEDAAEEPEASGCVDGGGEVAAGRAAAERRQHDRTGETEHLGESGR